MIRMLHIVGSMSPSGIGNFIMNIYRNIDRDKVQFDFIAHERREVSFDDEIIDLGGRIHYVTLKSVSAWKNFKEIRSIIKKEKYDIVFRHTDTAMVAVDLLAAKLGGAKRRIPHSHSTDTGNRKIHNICRPLLNLLSTERFACSEMAGKWMYGKKNYEVIMNGIKTEAFAYNGQVREQVRETNGWKDSYVIGHVGNFMPVKNHSFMLQLISELRKQMPDVKLALVGGGDLQNEIDAKIDALKIQDSVCQLGVRNDINEILQGMDLFLFPSKYEGMPIAIVEAQAAGLPCLMSDVVTDDVIVTPECYKCSLEADLSEWIRVITEISNKKAEIQASRIEGAMKVENSGFSVRELAARYERL